MKNKTLKKGIRFTRKQSIFQYKMSCGLLSNSTHGDWSLVALANPQVLVYLAQFRHPYVHEGILWAVNMCYMMDITLLSIIKKS